MRSTISENPLEVGHAREHGEHHAPGGRGGVRPRLGQRAQARAGLLDALGDFEQVTGGAGQPVQASDYHKVACAQVIEQPAQFGPLAPGPADLFLEETGAARLAQGRALRAEVLALGGYTGVADLRAGRGLLGHGRVLSRFMSRKV